MNAVLCDVNLWSGALQLYHWFSEQFFLKCLQSFIYLLYVTGSDVEVTGWLAERGSLYRVGPGD